MLAADLIKSCKSNSIVLLCPWSEIELAKKLISEMESVLVAILKIKHSSILNC